MIGFREACRHCDDRFRDGFALECHAMKVRKAMGLTNLKIMVPFRRAGVEGGKVFTKMARHWLVRGANGLKLHAICDIPSNFILAREFA